MMEFWQDLSRYSFLQMTLLVGLLASVACGVIGSYVVVRRITYIAGGIAHCVLGGMGAAWYLKGAHGIAWITPLHGAIVAALAAAIVIGLVSMRARQREDTVISALWAVGMAAGVLFVYATPGQSSDLMSYLFGNILLVGTQDAWLLLGLDALVIGVGFALYNQFLAISFDEEFARLRGLPCELYYLLLLCLVALTVVLLIYIVGMLLVIALLTLPVAIAGYFCRRLWQLMLLSMALCAVFTTSGLALSYGPNLPAGATTIVLAGGVYLLVVIGARVVRIRSTA
jgi:zinc transport system permease protein